jgi:hypothetical protein
MDKADQWIAFFVGKQMNGAKLEWSECFSFPCATETIDCTHVPIAKPSHHGNEYSRISKHQKHPNNVIIEVRFGIVVPKATTTVSIFLTTCSVVDNS